MMRPDLPQPSPVVAMATADPYPLKWDAELKEYASKPGEMTAPFTFWLTNVSSAEVLIKSVRTSCGCTVAKLPAQPWHIPPGGTGPIDVTVNLAGKGGTISKGVTVESTVGIKMLTVKVNIARVAAGPVATMNDSDRLKNMQMALSDRQVVFKNQECAKCHADPAKGKAAGMQVYAAVCGVCHDSHLRAALVPDLRNLNHPTDAEHWRKWITYGRPGSMMPAFADSEGGPLTRQQIDALVDYMVRAFPSRVAQAGSTATAPHSGADAQSVSAFRPPKAN
jgi:mono/diheme cytochrome c family protein